MSASPDPSADHPGGPLDSAPVAPLRGELFFDDSDQITIAARPAPHALPFTVNSDYARVVDDLEWGLF